MDQVEAVCQQCGAKYRVAARLAGRTAKCKKCGAQFTIPASSPDLHQMSPEEHPIGFKPSETIQDHAHESDPEPSGAPDLFALRPELEREETVHEEESSPLLPPIVADAILPLIILIACLGSSIYVAVMHAIHSSGPVMAYILIGFCAIMYLPITMTLVLKAVESSARTSDYELPNSVWLQTFALISIPTCGLIVGWFHGGT